jgi:hypothetical protein
VRSAAGDMLLIGEQQQQAVLAQQGGRLPVQGRVDRWLDRHSVGVQQDWIAVVQAIGRYGR